MTCAMQDSVPSEDFARLQAKVDLMGRAVYYDCKRECWNSEADMYCHSCAESARSHWTDLIRAAEHKEALDALEKDMDCYIVLSDEREKRSNNNT